MRQSTEETLIKDRNRCIILDTKGAFDWSYQISCNVIFCPLKMLQTSEYFLSSIFLDIAVQWMLFLEVPSIYSYPGTPSIEQALIKERQLEDRSFLCMACFFFLGKSVKLFDFLWHSLVSCGKKSRNRNIHRMSTFVVADKLSINCDQV